MEIVNANRAQGSKKAKQKDADAAGTMDVQALSLQKTQTIAQGFKDIYLHYQANQSPVLVSLLAIRPSHLFAVAVSSSQPSFVR